MAGSRCSPGTAASANRRWSTRCWERTVRSSARSARLTDEGASYREIKDSCRRELGLDLLRRSSLPIEEIAVRLDFCDSDAFRRAFHDWLGMPPTRYRREALAEG